MSTVGKQQLATGETNMQPSVSPVKFLATMNAYQRTSALKAAIDLELFDFLVISGFLNMLSIAR